MKTFLLLIIILQLNIDVLYAQCNITTSNLRNGTKLYENSYETIYENEDLLNGVLTAMAKVFIGQDPKENKIVKTGLSIFVGSSGSKDRVTPRKLKVYFIDNSSFEIIAETLLDPKLFKGAYIQQCVFTLKTEELLMLKSKSISKIEIVDSRTNKKIVCNPYKDMLREQVICISNRL